jgi:glycosyltransferase involved in cell wall biosynthesis
MLKKLQKILLLPCRWRVRRHKEKVLKRSSLYKEKSFASFLILSFNHRHRIKRLLKGLRQTSCEELIVCEDGSIDGSHRVWTKLLDQPNEFVLRSNDLHEIRSLDRGIHFAKGEIICLIQDDDVPSLSPVWFEQAMTLFEKFPDLTILGGWCACHGLEEFPNSPGDIVNQYTQSDFKEVDGIPFRFVEMVNIGPFFIRKAPFLEMGGFDFDYSPIGWPGIHFDFEICLRAWTQGGKVGWYQPPDYRDTGEQGTAIFGQHGKRVQQRIKNYKRLCGSYSDQFVSIKELVEKANLEL